MYNVMHTLYFRTVQSDAYMYIILHNSINHYIQILFTFLYNIMAKVLYSSWSLVASVCDGETSILTF